MAIFTSCRTWSDDRIAALSLGEIARLNYDEMLELVSSAQPTQTPCDAPRITESAVLVRHVYALRQRCRSKLAHK
ncbi:MAG: hypothetical protein O3C40_10040 [Planctomycetota bacterium]|nr:hypothetical protein [Planctomycetota bacterium]